MAVKNTTGKALRTEQERSTPSISVRIDRLVDYDNSKLKAIASVNIGGAFAIHGLRVIDSQKGLFVQMPQNSFQRDGKTEYSDIFHPITAEARSELNSKVLEAYEQELTEAESESEDSDEQDEEAPAFGQNM
jgi:stage V sporulation protein G